MIIIPRTITLIFARMTKIVYVTENEAFRSLCHKYWLLNDNRNFTFTAKELGIMYRLKTHALHSIACKSAKYVSAIKCCSCGNPKLFSNRTEFNKFSHISDWVCECCAQIAYEREQAQIDEYIRSNYNKNYYNVNELNDLTLFYLAVFLEFISEDCWIKGYKYRFNKDNLLTHSQVCDKMILTFLFEAGLIKLMPQQNKHSFYIKNDGSIHFDVTEAYFLPNIVRDQCKTIFHILKSDVFLDKIKNNNIIKDIGVEMQLAMCIKHAMAVGLEYGFSLKEMEKLSLVINYGLSIHSMNNIYYFIWRAIKEAVVQSHKEGVVKIQAIRSIPIRINADIVKSVEKNWEIYKLKVPYNFSAFEYILYNCIFSRSDYGFHVCIKE